MVFFFHFILDFFFTSAIHKIDGMYLVIRHQMLVLTYIHIESSSANVVKVWTFWETHKIWKNLPYGFDKSADLLSKCQNQGMTYYVKFIIL